MYEPEGASGRLHDRLLWGVLIAVAVGVSAAAGWRALERWRPPDWQLVSISIHPERDTPDVLQRYSAAFAADRRRWHFLTGDRDTIRELEASFLTRSVENLQAEPGQRFSHSSRLMLVGPDGKLHGVYACVEEVIDPEGKPTGAFRINPAEMERLKNDGRALAAGRKPPSPGLGLPVARFLLLDQDGVRFGSDDLKDQVWVAAFIFTRCQMSCPTVSLAMSQLQDRSRRLLPAVNAGLNGTAALLLILGWIAIRCRWVVGHAACMLAATSASALFLASYLYYHFAVIGGEPTSFQGPSSIRWLYYAILFSHTVLALAVVPLVFITLYQATAGRYSRHVRIARWTLPIWLYVSVTGVLVYLFLYVFFPAT